MNTYTILTHTDGWTTLKHNASDESGPIHSMGGGIKLASAYVNTKIKIVSYGPAQPIPVFSGLCKIVKCINYDFTEILKSDSAQLRLFRSLNA